MPQLQEKGFIPPSPVGLPARTALAQCRSVSPVLRIVSMGLALAMVLFHVLIALLPLGNQLMNQNTHLGFCLVLIFLNLAATRTGRGVRGWFAASALLALALTAYVAIHQDRLALTAGFPLPADVLVGIGLMGLVLGATWASFGALLPILALAALAYALGGHLLPGYAGHPFLPYDYIVSSLSVGFQGVYGLVLNASVTVIFLLVVFGALFEATGVTAIFMQIGLFMGRTMRGGAGQSAIIASTLTGMFSGVAAANVAVTGFNTIPAMEVGGFNKKTAGAIEAVASTGGQMTPPVMGIAVFIMAGFLGVGCSRIMVRALVPAIGFYAVVVLGVMIIAFREEIAPGTVRENRRAILAGLPVFGAPMGILALLLSRHHSIGYAAVWALVTLLAAAGIQKTTRPDFRTLLTGFARGAALGAAFGAACACIGMLLKCLTVTGAMAKLGMVTEAAGQGSQWVSLVLTMLLCLALGAFLPTVAAYVLVALTAVPVLTDVGLSPRVSHFFVFYFGVMANVMPPVAGASLVASQISGADYMETAIESFKLALPFVPLPFFLVRNPVLFLEAQPLASAVAALVALAVAMVSLACFCQNHGRVSNSRLEQAVLPVASMLATGYGLNGQCPLLAGSLALFFFYSAGQRVRCGRTDHKPCRVLPKGK